MTVRLATRRLAVCAVVVLALAATGAGVGAGRVGGTDQNRPDNGAAESEVLIVDDDGSADYASIQAAVDAADPGDTVRVMPGTYRESVTVAENLTVVAPRGATLDGSGLGEEAEGIVIGDTAAPVVDGFTVDGYQIGVEASRTSGDWTLRNATLVNVSFISVYASGASGDWRIRDVTIRNTSSGLDVTGSTGDWRATGVVVRNVTMGNGVDASPSGGNWTIADSTFATVDYVGIAASYTSGDWTVVNSTVRDAIVGIAALDASGDWTVRRSVLANVSVSDNLDFMQPPLEEGVGVFAPNTNGTWTVRGNRFVDTEGGGVVAPDADPAGDATLNWWGAGGPTADDCSGNVDCGAPLSTWPPETPVGTPTPVDPDAAGTTTTGPQTTEGTPASGGTDVPASASRSGTPTDTTVTPSAAGSDAATDAAESPASRTTAGGPLSPVAAVLGVIVGGLLAGRGHWRR
ncbi:right-handed parallel beta-helix repeat-containing protein [Halosimplex aquaticum]